MSLLDILPKLPFSGKEEKHEYFFSLNITPGFLTAGVWGVVNKSLKIINISQAHYEGEDQLIDSANRALDEALADFSPEPTKILFGVPDNWLENENLKEDYMKLLKGLVKQVDLAPIAYVSTNFAISHLYQKQNGVPLTGIIVNVDREINAAVAKAGKIVSSGVSEKSNEYASSVEKILAGFEVEVLPSKILLNSSSLSPQELEKVKDDLQRYPWMNNLPFLHLPKVEILDPSSAIQSICLAGAAEIDPDVIYKSANIEIPKTALVLDEGIQDLPEESNLREVGFVEGDISEEVDEELPKESYLEEDEVLEEQKDLIQTDAPLSHPHHYLKNKTENKRVFSLAGLPLIAGDFVRNIRVPKISRNLLTNKFGLITAGVIIALVAAYITLPKAKVTIYVDPKILENSAQVVADPAVKVVDEANNKIPGKLVETEVSGSDTIAATGKKKIGDSAKGKVLIYNKTSAPKTFPSGTVLNSGGSISYILDSSVNIASQSAVEGGISFGKASVSVSASDIGPEGNLSAGKDLTIKGESASNFTAKVDQDISGGTSKEVTVVTSDDQKKLLAKVAGGLRKKAKDDIQGKLTTEKILEEALIETVGKTTYSKSVNDQASDFSLNLSVHFRGVAYSENDLKLIVSKLVETNVPEGFELNLADTDTQADVLKAEKDKLTFQAKFKAKLFPKFNTEELKKQISGKTFADVASIVRRHENVIESEIKSTFALPSFLQRLPLLAQNITIEVLPR